MKKDLPDYMQRALNTGERTWHSTSLSRRHLTFSIAMSAYMCCWEFDDYCDAILDPKNIAGEKFQDMPVEKAKKELAYDWEKAVDLVLANPPMKGVEMVRKRLEKQVEFILSLPWGGRTGSTDRHVLLTMVSLSYEVGTYTPAFSTRTLAVASGKTTKTVRAPLNRLRESGHLKIVTPSTPTKSAIYEITSLGTKVTPLITYSPRESSGVSSVEVSGHDIFTYGCLGNTAFRLWSTLNDSREYTVKEMAGATGLPENTCRNAANKLASVGLVSKREGRPAYYKVEAPYGQDPAYLDQLMSIAADMWEDLSIDLRPYVGRGDKREATYEQEREAQRLRFAKYDRTTGCYVDPTTGEVLKDTAA